MTPRVNIVLAEGDREWICGRFARELVDRLPAFGVEAEINLPETYSRDLEYYLPVYGPPDRRPAVGLFTHGEDRPRLYGPDYVGALTFSSTLKDWLARYGGPEAAVLDYPVDPSIALGRRLVFGVAGRVYPDGRKGERLVAAAVAVGYEFLAWGHGWPCRTTGSDLEDLPAFYRAIDFYVETSLDEGGCVPAAEAAAMGVPVISHTVGVSRPVIPYERGDWGSLAGVLRRLTTPYTYEDFARQHAEVFWSTLTALGMETAA